MNAVKNTRFPVGTVREAMYESLSTSWGREGFKFRLFHSDKPSYTELLGNPIETSLSREGDCKGEALIFTLLAVEQVNHTPRILDIAPVCALGSFFLKLQSGDDSMSSLFEAEEEDIALVLRHFAGRVGRGAESGLHTMRKSTLDTIQ